MIINAVFPNGDLETDAVFGDFSIEPPISTLVGKAIAGKAIAGYSKGRVEFGETLSMCYTSGDEIFWTKTSEQLR